MMKNGKETRGPGRPRTRKRSKGLLLALEAMGTVERLAVSLGISKQAVEQWNDIPDSRLGDVGRVTKVSLRKLKPDMFKGTRR